MVPVRPRSFALFFLVAALLLVAPSTHDLLAQSKAQIESQIDEHNQRIKDLEKEIAAYQQQLNVLGVQKNTLQSAIKTLDVSRQQTSTQINVTHNKISATNLKLQELSGAISEKEYLIELDKRTVAASLRDIDDADDMSVIEQLFSSNTLADAWEAVDQRVMVSNALREHANSLAIAKQELTFKKVEEDGKKQELTSYSSQLVTQKKTLDVQKAEKDKLLNQTKSQESTYQALIAKKRAEQKAFEAALSELENSLKSVGAANIPAVGSGILSWPYSAQFKQACDSKAGILGNAYCITQYFGNTSFSTANPQIYNGAGHNAIDIGMPSGTPVLAALSGTVLAIGNTDSQPGCYSFGKWIMLKHANGLSTLYSHLSSIGVSTGQSVSTGQAIGNSGMTGYATGPHLHFGVYASAGVQITTLSAYRAATTPCANATMPVAPKDAYLNPMSYL
ncbi:MAG TPA: peptidoglycan DD-metalloendopeptidase family protein [Candidatus Paceibacterota bacterium]|nr:peptidoglycan DD-metalloendopeptidase family protein [Candidatus Paceibacterota bacterium]